MLTKEQITKLEKGELNTGLILGGDNKDIWLAGLLSGINYEVVVKDGIWREWYPSGEKQKQRGLETMNCTSYGTLNACIETQVNRLLALGLIELDEIWLDKNGKLDLSDSYLGKGAGTTSQGNSMQNPLEFHRKFGACPQKIRSNKFGSWNEYYRPITEEEYEWGRKWLEMFDFAYERIPASIDIMSGGRFISQKNIDKHLKQAPLYIAVATCPGWFSDSVIKACSMTSNHALMLGAPKKEAFDSYEPFVKQLADNYIIAYAYKGITTPKNLILKQKPMDTKARIVKVANSNEVGIYVPAIGEKTFKNMAENHGIDVPTVNGEVNWDQVTINGEVEFYKEGVKQGEIVKTEDSRGSFINLIKNLWN